MPATPQPDRIPVVVDTDGGIDDAAALWYLLTHPRVDVVAVTVVHGNVPLDVAGASVCRVLAAAGRPSVPVALGAAEAMGPAPEMRPATFIHGDDGLGNTDRPHAAFGPVMTAAGRLLHDVVQASPGELTVLTLGPLTNIGQAVAADPDWAAAVRRVVVMGGAARGPGNAQPFAEANIAHDPVAAAAVVDAAWPDPGLLVGLDVTNRATLTAAEFDLLAECRNPAAAFMDAPHRFYRTFGGTFSPPGETPCHDLTAAMALVDPTLVEAPLLPVAVDTTGGPAWGATIVDLRQPFFARADPGAAQSGGEHRRWHVALEVDVARFRAEVRRLYGD
jgi:purine nucleosidase